MATVLYEKSDKIARITLNRPEKLNAINDALFRDLEAALDEAQRDPGIWVVVIRGAGRAFSVGLDLSGVGTSEMESADPRHKPYLSDLFENAAKSYARWRRIFDFPRFTIAQVQGYCLGLGCELAMCCRAVIASEDAIFGDPSIRMGWATSNPLWTWKVGLKKTKELLYTGQYINGKEAERLGLVMKAVPKDKLEEEVKFQADSQVNFGSIGGFDYQVGFWETRNITRDLAGLSAAWRFSNFIHTVSAIQRPGRSITGRGEFSFHDVREKKGMKAAIEERDAPFRKYFPHP